MPEALLKHAPENCWVETSVASKTSRETFPKQISELPEPYPNHIPEATRRGHPLLRLHQYLIQKECQVAPQSDVRRLHCLEGTGDILLNCDRCSMSKLVAGGFLLHMS